MSISYGKLLLAAVDIPSTAASAAVKILYTVGPDLDRVIPTQAMLKNHSEASAVVSMWVVESGGSVTNTKKILVAQAIGKHEPYYLPELVGRAILQGGTVRAESSVAGAVSLSFTGNEVDVA